MSAADRVVVARLLRAGGEAGGELAERQLLKGYKKELLLGLLAPRL